MIRHIVMWNHKEGVPPEEAASNAAEIKRRLEALASVIPGVAELRVLIKPVAGSDRDVVLNSLFENEEALNAYQVHPAHQEAGAFVRQCLCNRACIDYEE